MVDNNVLKHINEILTGIEKENNVKILYAVESGSRAWGYHSPDSDYDIRFIYVHNDPYWYLQLNKKPTETINGFSKDRIYDWDGWDIRKAIQHIKESNPAILEWLSSPIIYKDIDGLADRLRNIVSQMHTNISLCYHYRNMAETNWNARIEGKEIVNTKKYLYILRPIGMLDWLMRFPDKPLVIDYYKILTELSGNIDSTILDKIHELLEYKKKSKKNGGKSKDR
jgi:predicted nucleotidyltransferase